MGITGLIPFLEKASKRANVSEFSGCTVAIDSYCWLHKGAFACAEKLVRGEDTDIHIKYCMKYVSMLLSKNIKPILVFDGRHLPAKAMTEAKRRESRDTSKKRAAELLSLGKTEEARSYMRRSIDITHAMALALIKECRKRNVDCIVAPYEADSQLAYLNIKNIAHLVITEDSDLILFGCTKVLFKMDLDGFGTLVETIKLPLVMKCPIENYTFDKFRRMCIMSGCDYLASLPGIGLAKARQFVTSTQDPDFVNALRKLPSFFNRSSLTVTDEYRENFLKAEATFKHQYVYDPIERQMVRLTEPDDEDIEEALCENAGELLEPRIAFQLALGNLDPFTLKNMDDWHPDNRKESQPLKSDSWSNKPSSHPSIWSKEFIQHLNNPCPWQKKKQPVMITESRPRRKVVNLVAKYVPETQDESLSIEKLSNMYSFEPANKKQKIDNLSQYEDKNTQGTHNIGLNEDDITKELTQDSDRSPILENKERSYKKLLKNNTYSVLKKLSRFPRTTLGDNVVESKFFSPNSSIDEHQHKDTSKTNISIEESPEKPSRNSFKIKSPNTINKAIEIDDDENLDGSQKENSLANSPRKSKSPILELKHTIRRMEGAMHDSLSEDTELVIENTYPMETLVTPVDSQSSFGASSQTSPTFTISTSQPLQGNHKKPTNNLNGYKKPTCRVPGLKRTVSLPSNQPTLLSKFGFQKKPALKR